MIIKKYANLLANWNTRFIDEDNVVWNIALQHCDGNVVLAFTCCNDEDYEFLHIVEKDESSKNKDNSFTLHGVNLQNAEQKTLIGKFYIEICLD